MNSAPKIDGGVAVDIAFNAFIWRHLLLIPLDTTTMRLYRDNRDNQVLDILLIT